MPDTEHPGREHYMCLSLEPPRERSPLTTIFPDMFPIENQLEGLQDLEKIETACGRQEMRVLLLSAHQLAFYVHHGLHVAICPKCMEHPDVALALLREL